MIKFAILLTAAAFAVPTLSPAIAANKNTNGVTSGAVGTTGKLKKPNGVKGVTGVRSGGVSELTSQECKGVGGKVTAPPPDLDCGAFDACATTDQHGVIRFACIDEVAPD